MIISWLGVLSSYDFYHSNHKFIRFQILQGLVAYNGFFTTTVLTD